MNNLTKLTGVSMEHHNNSKLIVEEVYDISKYWHFALSYVNRKMEMQFCNAVQAYNNSIKVSQHDHILFILINTYSACTRKAINMSRVFIYSYANTI